MFVIQHRNFNRMTSPMIVFYLTYLLLGKMAQMKNFTQSTTFHQDTGFISANVGADLTLQCFYDGDSAKYYWYMQTLGQKPQLMATTFNYGKIYTFQGEFENNSRFTLQTNVSVNHLKISDLQLSDSATYYCARGNSLQFDFAEGKTVSIQDSGLNIKALVHQSASETIQPGGSVTLNCTVHTGTCDGENNIYWFKNSEESSPGLIYTHGGRTDQCEREPNTQTHTCVYNLPIKTLDSSAAGTYYCAVATCGHILFGNGTKVDFEDEVESLVLVYFLSGALTFTTILSVLLAFTVYKMNKRNSCQYSESCGRSSTPSTTNAEGYQDRDVHYAALNVNLPNRSRRQRDNAQTECVYSSVRQ